MQTTFSSTPPRKQAARTKLPSVRRSINPTAGALAAIPRLRQEPAGTTIMISVSFSAHAELLASRHRRYSNGPSGYKPFDSAAIRRLYASKSYSLKRRPSK